MSEKAIARDATMKLIFFDTEFTGLVVDPQLISIGCVDETGTRTFYAELSDTWQPGDAGAFARAAVLPLLEGGAHVMTMTELIRKFGAWIASFEAPVQLATDSKNWDWPWIHEIFHEPGSWPVNLEGRPLELQVTPIFADAVERAFALWLRRHHALDDAKANRLGWLAQSGVYV